MFENSLSFSILLFILFQFFSTIFLSTFFAFGQSLNYQYLHIPGWFIDEKTSTDADIAAVSVANNPYTFQSVYENVSVCINLGF
jgi:hypothetical protein